jgi:phosphoribosylformylglycinamidine cyclo-ligase
VHSNGYSLVRRIVEISGLKWSADCPWGDGTLGAALLAPTRLYVKGADAAIRADAVNGLAHITGGGLTENVPRALPDGLGVEIDLGAWTAPGVFKWLAETGGIAEAEMLKTFNSGIGMVAIVPKGQIEQATAAFESDGHAVTRIGQVVEGEGVTYRGKLF